VNNPIIVVDKVTQEYSLHKEKTLKGKMFGFFSEHKDLSTERFKALSNISFELHEGESLALIGHNGSGKSTLLSIIGGITTPSLGTVQRRGRLAALLELQAGFHPDLTGRENIYLSGAISGFKKNEVDRKLDQIIEFSGIEEFIDVPVKFYSSGMGVRLGFAVAAHAEADILLVDEVLAVGDADFQRKCLEHIRDFQRGGGAIVFVSHSPDLVQEFCNRAIMLEHGVVVADGFPPDVLDVYTNANMATLPRKTKVISVKGFGSKSPGMALEPGEDLTVECEIEIHENLPWLFRAMIRDDQSGVQFISKSTYWDSGFRAQRDGIQNVRIVFEDLPSIEGDYRVSIELENPNQMPPWQHMENGFRFQIVN